MSLCSLLFGSYKGLIVPYGFCNINLSRIYCFQRMKQAFHTVQTRDKKGSFSQVNIFEYR